MPYTYVDNRLINIFERKVLRTIYGPVYNSDIQVWEKRSNKQLKQLYGKGNIIQFIEGVRENWTSNV